MCPLAVQSKWLRVELHTNRACTIFFFFNLHQIIFKKKKKVVSWFLFTFLGEHLIHLACSLYCEDMKTFLFLFTQRSACAALKKNVVNKWLFDHKRQVVFESLLFCNFEATLNVLALPETTNHKQTCCLHEHSYINCCLEMAAWHYSSKIPVEHQKTFKEMLSGRRAFFSSSYGESLWSLCKNEMHYLEGIYIKQTFFFEVAMILRHQTLSQDTHKIP